jgi:hypothetical protein
MEDSSMKLILKILCLIALLDNSQLSVADSWNSQSEINHFKVKVTDSAKSTISKLPLVEQERVKNAQKIGASFMRQYLEGDTCNGVEQQEDDQVVKIVATSLLEAPDLCSLETAWWQQKNNFKACNMSSLIEVKLEKDEVILKYQTLQIGELIGSGSGFGPAKFLPIEKRQAVETIVFVNAENKVNDIIPRGAPNQDDYTRSLKDFRQAHFVGLDTGNMKAIEAKYAKNQ